MSAWVMAFKNAINDLKTRNLTYDQYFEDRMVKELQKLHFVGFSSPVVSCYFYLHHYYMQTCADELEGNRRIGAFKINIKFMQIISVSFV